MRWATISGVSLALASGLARHVDRALWPVCCVFCGEPQRRSAEPVCAGCHADLPWLTPRFELEPFVFAAAPLEYAFPVDAAIKALKFRRKLYYAPAFAWLLGQLLHQLPADIDAVLPVPLHWRRHALRGFNQAAEIARPLARRLGVPVIDPVARRRSTPFQSGLSAAQRRRNLAGAFTLRREPGRGHILLVDDVVTTGETCRRLAAVLHGAGVPAVSVVAIARARPG